MSADVSGKRVAGRGRRVFTFLVFVGLASMDNAAAGVLPPLYAIIAREFNANEAVLGVVTAVYVLIAAFSAAFWGYRGDRSDRKRLLLGGTLIWGAAMVLTGLSRTLPQFVIGQLVTAVGVGSIASVGFSVISDVIPARRRGLALSLWGISQSLGAGLGAVLAGSLGAYDWRWPFWFIAAVGLLFAFLYLFAAEPARGGAEPELAPLFAAGQSYNFRISRTDLGHIVRNRANLWLTAQNVFATLTFGSTVWVPRWAIARIEAMGYSLETSTIVGNLIVILFSAGLLLGIFAGHVGDRWQLRDPLGRVKLALIGTLGSAPFFILTFFAPVTQVAIPLEGNIWQLALIVVRLIFTDGAIFVMFLAAFTAMALLAADGPNWAALITEVNLPEHRGTVIGVTRIAHAVSNAASIALTGFVLAALSQWFAPPDNYSWGLALFQLFAIPTALCYYGGRRSIVRQTAAVRQTLRKRAMTAVAAGKLVNET